MEGKREHNHPAEPQLYEISQAKAQLRQGLERYLATSRNESPETFIPEVSESMYRAMTHCDYEGILRKEDSVPMKPGKSREIKEEGQVTLVIQKIQKKETLEPSDIKVETEEDPLSLSKSSVNQGKILASLELHS